MTYSSGDATRSDVFNMPLGAYNTFENSENYPGTQPSQTANPYSYSSPQQLQPATSTSAISTWDYNPSSSNSYLSSLPSLSWTSDASPSDFYPIPLSGSSHNRYPSPFITPLTEDDYTFFANVDLPPLDSNLFNVTTNPPMSHSPGPEPVVRHISPPSTKRPYINEESECPDNASKSEPFNHKRRKLSTNDHQDLPNVPPPRSFHNGNNIISGTFNDFNAPVETNNGLLANIDPLLNPNPSIVTLNPSIPHAPNPIGHRSPPYRKRTYPNGEPDPHNASFNPHPKRHRRSINGHKNLSTIPPPPHSYNNNNNNNPIPNTVHNYYVPTSPAPTLSRNAIPVPQPYSNHNMFYHAPAPFVNIPPAPAIIPPAYVPATQPGSSVPSRTIDYSADSNGVYSNPNSYTATGGHNAFSWDPPLSYLTSLQAGNEPLDWTTAGLSGTENFLNNDVTAATPGPSVRTLVPPFLEQQVQAPVPYCNSSYTHTDAFANNAMHSGVDICQHSRPTHSMSMTGHTANARMPSTHMPPTRVASSAETVLTFNFYHPTPSPASPAIPTSRPRAPHKRHGPQLVPATHLWTRTDEGYKCLYDGPAAPGGCGRIIHVKDNNPRNLGRHMRIHACEEDKMAIPEEEKIALNGLPDDLRVKFAICSLDDADLHHCAYFREQGKRWKEETLERTDNLQRKHDRWNHPPHLRRR